MRAVVLFSFSLKLGQERYCSQSKNLRKATNNNTTCHNNKVCHHLSFQTNRNAAFLDECGEFKIHWLSCRLTLPRPILLAASLADFRWKDTRVNNTLGY